MASQVYTLPTSVSTTTWQRLQVSVDTVALSFKNDSKYDWLLVFGGFNAPTFTASSGGQANAYVNALEYPTIWVQAPGVSEYERARNATRAFDGNIWYLAVDNTAGLAQVGGISSRTVINIITYGPYDAVPPSGLAVARQTDLTNQPRIITLPAALNTWGRDKVVLPNDPFTGASVWGNSPAPSDLGSSLIQFNFAAGTAKVAVYVMRVNAYPLTVGRCTFELWACTLVGAVKTSIFGTYLARCTVALSGARGPMQCVERVYPFPRVPQDGVPDSAATAIGIYYVLRDGDGGMTVDVECDVWLDCSGISGNTHFPGPYGLQSLYVAGDKY